MPNHIIAKGPASTTAVVFWVTLLGQAGGLQEATNTSRSQSPQPAAEPGTQEAYQQMIVE